MILTDHASKVPSGSLDFNVVYVCVTGEYFVELLFIY